MPAAAPVDEGPLKELTQEANERLAGCEAQKREYDLDIRESYYFAAPHRAREIRSAQAISTSKPSDAHTLQTGVAGELPDDFMTELINGFMPPAAPWAERKPGAFIPQAFHAEVEKQVKIEDPKIFEAIRASNLYEEMPKLAPDPAIGTAALWIQDLRPSENIVVQAVPLHELEINLGPFGALDDRFVVRHTKNRHVKAVVGKAIYDEIPEETRKTIEDTKNRDKACIVRWGYWRLWDRMDNVVWQHVVMLDAKVIHEAKLVGEGSCPLIPFRFNPCPEWAFGNGPLIKSLPDLRQLDDIQGKKVEYIDLTLAPPTYYPDDSFTHVENGVEAGKMYPKRPSMHAGRDVGPIFEPGSMEPAIYETDYIERTLRRRFYVDLPQQRGDTPPTATQWLDEMQRALRRFGTPGASFWREGPAEIFLRFKFLLEARGVATPIKVDGKTVSLQPFNPAQRAAEMEEVAMASRYLEMVLAFFPEEAKARLNGTDIMDKLAKKMRVVGENGIISFRSNEEIKGVLQTIAPLLAGGQEGGAAPAQPGMPA